MGERRGIAAIGDSLINGHGDPMLGVQCQSAALWLSRAGRWPLSIQAVGGVRSDEVVRQLDLLDGEYEVALFDMGTNDVLSGWQPHAFAAALDEVSANLTKIADRVLVLSLPPIGLPGVPEANALIREAAARHGLLLVDIGDFTGHRLMTPDGIHPSALGHLEIAQRAARLLGMDRMPSEETLGHPDAPLGLAYHIRWEARRAAARAKARAKKTLRGQTE